MSLIPILLVLIFSFLAGVESVLDEFQFHQPIVACSLIGLATGHLPEALMLGGSLQLVALGWMNIGAAVAPDAALCSTASAILVCMKGVEVSTGIASAMALAVAGLALTIFVRTIAVGIVHGADRAGASGNIRGVEFAHYLVMLLQGLRCAIPALLIILVPVGAVQAALSSIPPWLTAGLSAAGGFIVVVGYAMVINMMATPKVWPFFIIGFALAAITQLNLIAMGMIGVGIALVYLQLAPEFNGGSGPSLGSGSSEDVLDDIINDYE
ncbi:phosphotransferase system PTS sorbose-specific IIC subunit [Coriobacterium glomerans PW2]|uniref:Phosphotransferase system PTS sorbose-specific IIC subunit n=1 Tax=Coriobacterium glomerans (strain ATCC 49209 / DSM 20642 / JCM 10262 / PW2) TaxID=700015 RepID=F2N717_CORGP|nr:PTS mannose/fructose/sorbose transporter subunit IIC [Coriobacterium glomerans]AEB06356.1 phosphotransferase system PTS sorbose-specific IIC subunit [Coriobacterium glomerans PW2]